MYSAYKLNKQGDNIQPWHTPFPIWNQSVVPCPVLTVASWPAYRFLKRRVRWSGILLFLNSARVGVVSVFSLSCVYMSWLEPQVKMCLMIFSSHPIPGKCLSEWRHLIQHSVAQPGVGSVCSCDSGEPSRKQSFLLQGPVLDAPLHPIYYGASVEPFGIPSGSDGEESACSAGDPGSIPGSGRSPEEGSGYSGILAWRIPWTEEPSGPQSLESQRVKYDWVTVFYLYLHYSIVFTVPKNLKAGLFPSGSPVLDGDALRSPDHSTLTETSSGQQERVTHSGQGCWPPGG